MNAKHLTFDPKAKGPVPILQERFFESGLAWMGVKYLVTPVFRYPDHQARSPLLYRLSHSGRPIYYTTVSTTTTTAAAAAAAARNTNSDDITSPLNSIDIYVYIYTYIYIARTYVCVCVCVRVFKMTTNANIKYVYPVSAVLLSFM